MSPEAQRIAIARACGWKENQSQGWGRPNVYDDDDPLVYWHTHQLPNYLNDLNAMHEAEKALPTDDLIRRYVDELFHIAGGGNGAIRFHGRWAMATATAAQKAEAFLKTLDLWKD